MNDVAAGAQNVRKRFGATTALDGVTFEVMAGEIHALVGENGAGKSTLVRILGGVFRPDAGEITIGGEPRHLSSPHDAIASGIVTIPQELHLVPALSVAENLALGDLPARRLFGVAALVDRPRMREDARALLAAFDSRLIRSASAATSASPSSRLSPSPRPCTATAAFSFSTSRRRRSKTARLSGSSRCCAAWRANAPPSCTCHTASKRSLSSPTARRIRDGRVAALVRRGEFNSADLVAAMTGHAAEQRAVAAATSETCWWRDAEPRADAVRVHSGEVVGLAGLLGSGTNDVLQRLFGLAPAATSVRVKGRLRRIKNPIAAIEAWGIGFVPPSRRLGLIMNQSVHDNILLPSLREFLGELLGACTADSAAPA